MRKVTTFRCPHCKAKYKSLQVWGNHISNVHPGLIPEGWSYGRYFYYIQTGKDKGSCIVCGNPTNWNEATLKYSRFCDNPECKKQYREMFRQRMIKVYGKDNLLNDPDQQRKMLAAKKMSGKYKFPYNEKYEFTYTGTYELDFLHMLTFMGFDPSDLMMPSPHTYRYIYKNPNDTEHEGEHFYIPDAYIPSLNLEIEIKQNTSTHPKIIAIDKVKEAQKDKMMTSQKNVNYLKIVDKNYTEFFQFIQDAKVVVPNNSIATESTGYDIVHGNNPRKRLSDFLVMPLSDVLIKDYKKSCPKLSSLKLDDRSNAECVVTDKEKCIGYYMCGALDKTTTSTVWLHDIFIDEEYRSSGLGYQLLTKAIRKNKITNVKVPFENKIMMRLVESAGFQEYSRSLNEVYYFLPENKNV